MTPKGQSQKDARMRREGYDDGYRQRPARSRESVYQQAWRRGWEQRGLDQQADQDAIDKLAQEGF